MYLLIFPENNKGETREPPQLFMTNSGYEEKKYGIMQL